MATHISKPHIDILLNLNYIYMVFHTHAENLLEPYYNIMIHMSSTVMNEVHGYHGYHGI